MSILLSVLGAVGAVLLFLLKLVGILLLVGLVLLALLLLCPFCADVAWEKGVLTVRAGWALPCPSSSTRSPRPPPRLRPRSPKASSAS